MVAGEAIDDFWSMSGKLHIPPSRWTQSQTLLAERRIIPYSTEIHWRLQNYADKLGCYARKPHRWLLVSMDQKMCLVLGQVSLSLLYWKRNLQTDICRPGGDWQNGKRHPGQIIHGQNSGEECQRTLSWGRSVNRQLKNQSSIMQADYE